MNLRFAVALASACALCACSGSPVYLAPQGVDAQQQKMDLAECRRAAGMQREPDEQELIERACMNARGYRVQYEP